MLTIEFLKSALDYSQNTGVFRWKDAGRRNDLNGKVAGTPDGRGYLLIKIGQKYYKAHRLAWFYVTGEWPAGDIDHINRERADNRFLNLRPASRAENLWNTPAKRNNTSGFKGVDRSCGKWRARIRHGGRRIDLGLFACPTAAHVSYVRAAKRLHGAFAPDSGG